MTRASAQPSVVLYGRAGCHLCEQARGALERVARRVKFDLLEVDIESDEALLRRYLERIPVVSLEGEELFEFFVDEEVMEHRVRRARMRPR